MEKILNKILDRLDSMDARFESMENRLGNVEIVFGNLDNRLGNLEEGQHSLHSEQGEMRKEMAFYYGSLMKKLDETKSGLTSEIKHVSSIQKQHQNVLEILNEKQQ